MPGITYIVDERNDRMSKYMPPRWRALVRTVHTYRAEYRLMHS